MLSRGFNRRDLIAGAAASACAWPALAATDGLAAIEARVGSRLGVAALDLASGAKLAHRADERFPMCSTFKAMAVASVLAKVDAGAERLDRFVRYGQADLLSYAPVTRAHVGQGGLPLVDLCAAAIEESDNGAANLILASLGGPAGWTRYVRSLGDTVSRLDQFEPELNRDPPADERDTTTPHAIALVYQRLLLGDALTADTRGMLSDWMARSTTGAKRIRAGFPPDWKVVDKTGTGDYGRANDVAVVWSPAGEAYVVAVMSDRAGGGYDSEPSDALVADAATAVADFLG
jgi:beta-lactamase class A